jgi:hypothetical protein
MIIFNQNIDSTLMYSFLLIIFSIYIIYTYNIVIRYGFVNSYKHWSYKIAKVRAVFSFSSVNFELSEELDFL